MDAVKILNNPFWYILTFISLSAQVEVRSDLRSDLFYHQRRWRCEMEGCYQDTKTIATASLPFHDKLREDACKEGKEVARCFWVFKN
jgi:hypothetical protein